MKIKLLSLTLVTSASMAHAVVLTGVTATADSTFNVDVPAANTTNESGLSASSITATHDADADGRRQWHTDVGVTGDTNITFDLGGAFDLAEIYIWQHNQVHPTLDLLPRGVDQYDILISTDSGANFNEVVTDATLAISPGGINTGGPITAQQVTFAHSGVTHVRFHIDSNHGDTAVVGLSEVKFVDTTVIPEPSSAALLGLGGLAFILRRRK